MLKFLIMLWLIIALIKGIPMLIKDIKDLIRVAKGEVIEEDVDDFILK